MELKRSKRQKIDENNTERSNLMKSCDNDSDKLARKQGYMVYRGK